MRSLLLCVYMVCGEFIEPYRSFDFSPSWVISFYHIQKTENILKKTEEMRELCMKS